jgi:hypothetical protein
MMALSAWLPNLAVGVTFTAFGLAKIYGLMCGIQGGGDKPAFDRACGSCPTWGRGVNLALTAFLLVFGLGNLASLGWTWAAGAGR